jgi:hypothetical protein
MLIQDRDADRRYSPQIPGLVGMVGKLNPVEVVGATAFSSANRIVAVRAIVPFSGVLHDLYMYVGSTTGGNCRGLVYDTGDVLPGSRSKLWDGGSIATGAINGWRSLGDPALNVRTGEHIDLAVQMDNTTALVGRVATYLGGTTELPTNFIPCRGGALAKTVWLATQGAFTAPVAIAEASCLSSGNLAPCLFARVVPA